MQIFREVHTAQTQVLGAEHPDTLITRARLGSTKSGDSIGGKSINNDQLDMLGRKQSQIKHRDPRWFFPSTPTEHLPHLDLRLPAHLKAAKLVRVALRAMRAKTSSSPQ
jgi:hypothetical protein